MYSSTVVSTSTALSVKARSRTRRTSAFICTLVQEFSFSISHQATARIFFTLHACRVATMSRGNRMGMVHLPLLGISNVLEIQLRFSYF